MILRPVRPVSPCGPPTTKRPVGLMWYLVCESTMFDGTTASMMCFFTSRAQFFGGDVGAVLRGDHHGFDALRLVADVFHADLALAVGPQEVQHALRGARRRGAGTSLCAIMIGSGISSGVSSQA